MRRRFHDGMLKGADAREWKHWWTVRGHIATLESANWRGYFHCYLILKEGN